MQGLLMLHDVGMSLSTPSLSVCTAQLTPHSLSSRCQAHAQAHYYKI